uniref:Uncharacterized protein n=1 Tax=Anguilla anguilla TaxID=7936 RepID=A0A0E9T911_ANGAN
MRLYLHPITTPGQEALCTV